MIIDPITANYRQITSKLKMNRQPMSIGAIINALKSQPAVVDGETNIISLYEQKINQNQK